jgi:hypothetical protein
MSQRSKRRRGPHRSGKEGAGGEAGPPGGRAGAGRPSGGEAGPPGGRAGAGGPTRGPSREGRPADRPRPAAGATSGRAASHRVASGWGLGVQLAFLVAVFAVVVLVAELAGAANLGVALGVGQIAFAIAVIYLLLRR